MNGLETSFKVFLFCHLFGDMDDHFFINLVFGRKMGLYRHQVFLRFTRSYHKFLGIMLA